MAEDVETNLKVVEPSIFAFDRSITSTEDFVGTWTNADLESGGMIKFVITQEDSEYYFHGYGACHPTPCDWGATPLTLYSKSVSDTNDIAGTAEYVLGFVETRIYLVMLNPYVIMAYNFDKFTDASGRHNYASMDCFTKVVVPEFSTTTPTPTPSTPLLPDLFVSEFFLDPSTPIQGSPVSVRVGVYNKGDERSGAFTVQWWAGENFPAPACTWRVDSMAAGGGRILTCSYDGYTSWYGSLTTKVVVDSAEEVAESNKENNEFRKTISVSKPSGVHIVFDALPDGTLISSDLILNGDEFLSKGIRLDGAPEGTYCSDAVAAIRCSGTYHKDFNFLTTSRPDNVKSCNGVPVAIIFESQVRHVTLTFAGASTTYTMKAYDSAGTLLGTVEQDAVLGDTFEVTFSSTSANINRVTFGRAAAVTAIKEIYYER
jgi:hypothetical protein